MDIQTEKLELMKILADVTNESIILKLKKILSLKKDETQKIMENEYLYNKILQGIEDEKEGKGIKIELEDLWK